MSLTNAGATFAAQAIVNDPITPPVFFNAANAYLGVGDSTTAFAATQTDLVAATNKLRKGMDGTFPTRAANVITFRATFATTEANWVWNEWGVFNASPTGGTMLSRRVDSLGAKNISQTWQLTATITLVAVP